MTIRLAMLLVISMAFGSVAGSQTPAADPAVRPLGLRQIIPGHYVFAANDAGRLFNSGVVATSEGVLVFDALRSDAIARAERQAIAGVTTQTLDQCAKLYAFAAQREVVLRRIYRELKGTLQ